MTKRARSAIPAELRVSMRFDAAQSTGLFVGVSRFEDASFARIPFAVDDAVDLAHLFTLELELVRPANIALHLSVHPGLVWVWV